MTGHGLFRLTCLVGLSLTAATSFAQEPGASAAQPSLEQLMAAEVPTVIGASRFSQQVIDAPASVTIVTSEDIERYGYQTLADLLRAVRGMYVTSDRNYSYVGIRGFSRPGDYNSRMLLLIDGHRINDGIFEMGPIGTDFPIDLALVDRVEIVRGPSSSLYGTSAFFGVINVVTRRGRSARSGVAVSTGSHATRDADALFGRRVAGADVQLAASEYRTDGQQTVAVGDGLSTVGMDYDRATRLFGSASRGRWTATADFATRTKGIPTGAYGTSLTDPGSETADTRGFVDLRYQRPVFGTSVLWRASYDAYHYHGVYVTGGGDPDNDDYAHAQWWGTEVSGTRRMRSHLVTAGSELRQDFQQDQGWFYADRPDEPLLDDRRDAWSWAAYAQDEVTLSRRVIVSGGLRFDHFSTVGATANPRLALIVKPRDRASLKVLVGTAFRAPNAYELYYYGDAASRLDPERIRTSEIVWEQHLEGPTRIATSVFHYTVEDLISQIEDTGNPDGIGFANVGGAIASGIESEVERSWRRMQIGASYSFTHAEADATGGRLPNSPRHLLRGRASSTLARRRLIVGGEWFAASAREGADGASAPSYGLASLTASSGDLVGGVRLRLDIDNFFDRQYTDPGAEEHRGPILQDGRTARATLAWRF